MENELQFFQNVPGRFSIGTVDANLKKIAPTFCYQRLLLLNLLLRLPLILVAVQPITSIRDGGRVGWLEHGTLCLVGLADAPDPLRDGVQSVRQREDMEPRLVQIYEIGEFLVPLEEAVCAEER